ncbi:hypothetical protein G5V57_14465 [Nordella sp. HKS 07]|uniref:hypothetical protein n=1 Tax=Nordella sp. HKS 07 TaxID=2712222 RepID=UPI0013E11C80|nr:hypothetical protein [Nordella sp. HKS 07]QIG48823.1 hypothetical protein G5V57_14465 [Nordella sp. HKS 07]
MLREQGIESVTTDVSALPGSEVISFDLSRFSEAAVDDILQAIDPTKGAYLTTCFDVLEHIDREHVSDAVSNLQRLTNRYLAVSISTRPSAHDNLLHATLLPIQTWIRVFEAVGFRLVELDAFSPAIARRAFPVNDELKLINRWVAADIFADVSAGEPRYIIFEKVAAKDRSSASSQINLLVDVSYRAEKRRQFSHGARGFNLSLHHHQEWSLLRPLLDVIPRAQARFLVRPEGVEQDTLRAVRSFLTRCGVQVIEYDDVRELPWSEMKGEVLISGAESSVGWGHLLGYETAAIARLHGCTTYLLQHGIWPRAFEHRVVTFASERVLTWGREDEHRLNERVHRFISTDVPWGAFPSEQAFPIGSAKFCDQQFGPFPGLDIQFGHDPSKFEQSVLVGVKDLRGRWGVRNIGAEFVENLGALISAHPTTLFVIRPHPSDSAETFSTLPRSNTVLFDNLAGIVADLPLSRVLPNIDLVLTSPSSLMVDAAVSSIPISVYDTGQPIEFDGISVVPFEAIGDHIRSGTSMMNLKAMSEQIRGRYAEAVDDTFYSKFSGLLEEPSRNPVDQYVAASASLAVQAVEQARTAKEASDEIAALKKQLVQVRERMTTLEHENVAMRNSTGWRISGPLRNIIKTVRGRSRS